MLLLFSFSDLSLQHLLLPFAPFSRSATFPFFFSLLSVRPACLSFRLCHLERCCHCPHCPGFSVMVNMQDYSSLFRHRLGASQFTSIIVTSYSGDESIIVFIFEMKKKCVLREVTGPVRDDTSRSSRVQTPQSVHAFSSYALMTVRCHLWVSLFFFSCKMSFAALPRYWAFPPGLLTHAFTSPLLCSRRFVV